MREYSAQELAAATRYYAAQASALAGSVPRDENHVGQFSDFATLAKQAGAGYEKLAQKYDLFSGSTDRVKKLATWKLFSHFGITGIFVCVTGEACVNPDTYAAWLPFTMCHEIAHRQTVAAEDGANFCAYLACMDHESAEFRYSGALVQFYAPKFGDVAQASGGWFASMPPKKSIRACSSAGRAFGSHPRGREFESLQVHQNVRNFLVFAEDSELFCIFQNQTLSTVAILPPFGSHPTQSRLKSSKETRNSTSKR